VSEIRCVVADSQTLLMYDLSKVINSTSLYTNMLDQPGKMTLSLVNSRDVDFHEGSTVSFSKGSVNMFKGYVFSITKRPNSTQIVCYDRIRYLGNRDSIVMSSTSINKVCAQVTKSTGIPISVVGGTKSLGKRVFDNQSYYSMIQWALTEDMKKTKEMHILRDDFGTLKVLDVADLMQPIVIGDGSLMNDWEYETSIDEQTYTVVKLIRDRNMKKKKVKRSTVVIKEDANIKKWGSLQYFDKIDDKTKDATMKKMAKDILDLYSQPTRTMNLTSIGYAPLRAGDGIGIKISDLDNEGFAAIKAAFCSSVNHTITADSHTMDLEVTIQ
jgi:hypothetical protein